MSTYSSKLPIVHLRVNITKMVEECFLQGNQYKCCWCNTKGTVQKKQIKNPKLLIFKNSLQFSARLHRQNS